MVKLITSIAIFTLCTLSLAADQQSVPIFIGGNDIVDACGSTGAVKGLSSKGDGYLSVRTGPGSHFKEKNRLTEGKMFYMCNFKESKSSSWVGIVYSTNNSSDCGVSSPIEKAIEYKGPCQWGWVNEKWVEVVAG